MAGHETTVNLIGNGMLALLHHPYQRKLLVHHPELIRQAVEEFLRYDSPVQYTDRIVAEAFDYEGHHFAQDSTVSFLIGAANRDPHLFDEPDQLNIQRKKLQHLSFGGGIHYCLGAPLARLEAEIAFTVLLRRLPKLALKGEAPRFGRNYLLRGLQSLPVTF